MSGLGERGKRLRAIASQLDPKPVVLPFFVQAPDELQTRAIGWHMIRERGETPEYLGHNSMAAELVLREQLTQPKKKPKRAKARAG